MLSKPSGHSSQGGLSLIELMISAALGIIILLAATTMFAATKQSARAQEAASRLMENGRAATELLNRSVRMARYFGCAGVESTAITNHWDSTTGAQSPTSLNGYDQQGLFGVDGTTDEIIVFRALDETARALGADIALEAGVTTIRIATAVGNPGAGDMISITDCTQADVFNVSAVASAGGIDDLSYANCPTCSHSFLANAPILNVKRERFYIDTGQGGRPALFLEDPQDGSDTPRELLEGVEDLQITYGIDTDADGIANQYVSPATIRADCVSNTNSTCWRKITSARIALLLATVEDGVTTRPQSYTFNGTDYTASDRRLRREFLTIVALRNYRP